MGGRSRTGERKAVGSESNALASLTEASLKGRNQQAAAWRRDPSRRADASSRRGGAPWLNNATRNGTCGNLHPRRPVRLLERRLRCTSPLRVQLLAGPSPPPAGT